MAGLRDAFAKASVAAARLWTYPPANSVLHPDDSYLIARVPVTFSINQPRARADDDYGRWQPYVAGPREVVPWLHAAQSATDGVDTAPQRSVLPLGQGPQVASPPTRNRSHVRGLNGQFEQRWR